MPRQPNGYHFHSSCVVCARGSRLSTVCGETSKGHNGIPREHESCLGIILEKSMASKRDTCHRGGDCRGQRSLADYRCHRSPRPQSIKKLRWASKPTAVRSPYLRIGQIASTCSSGSWANPGPSYRALLCGLLLTGGSVSRALALLHSYTSNWSFCTSSSCSAGMAYPACEAPLHKKEGHPA